MSVAEAMYLTISLIDVVCCEQKMTKTQEIVVVAFLPLTLRPKGNVHIPWIVRPSTDGSPMKVCISFTLPFMSEANPLKTLLSFLSTRCLCVRDKRGPITSW